MPKSRLVRVPAWERSDLGKVVSRETNGCPSPAKMNALRQKFKFGQWAVEGFGRRSPGAVNGGINDAFCDPPRREVRQGADGTGTTAKEMRVLRLQRSLASLEFAGKGLRGGSGVLAIGYCLVITQGRCVKSEPDKMAHRLSDVSADTYWAMLSLSVDSSFPSPAIRRQTLSSDRRWFESRGRTLRVPFRQDPSSNPASGKTRTLETLWAWRPISCSRPKSTETQDDVTMRQSSNSRDLGMLDGRMSLYVLRMRSVSPLWSGGCH